MSMSTFIIGIKPPDEKWEKMKAIWDTCKLAGVEIPEEVDVFFDGESPDDKGVIVDIEEMGCCTEYKTNDQIGHEININELPKDITIIRVYNSR